MNKEELWNQFVAKNPSFADPDAQITMTARGLRKFYEQTWKFSNNNGFDKGLSFAKKNPDPTDPYKQFMSGIFKDKRQGKI